MNREKILIQFYRDMKKMSDTKQIYKLIDPKKATEIDGKMVARLAMCGKFDDGTRLNMDGHEALIDLENLADPLK